MSVTILSIADTHTPAYNNQNLVASSTNSSQTNFKYVVTVEVNDGFSVQNIELKILPRPDNSKLYFNPQRVVEANIASVFTPVETANNYFFYPSLSEPSQFKKVTIGIDEEYGTPVSGFGGASGSYYVWNGAYDSLDFADFTYSTTTKAKDLTLSPSNIDTINYNQRYLFKSWNRGFSTRDLRYLFLTSVDSAGNTIQDVVIENLDYDVTPNYRFNYVGLNCSPYSFNRFYGAPIIYQLDPVADLVPAATASYTFYFSDQNPPLPGISSNLNTVIIDDYCSMYKKYVMHFLNEFGNYDSYTFNLLSRNNTEKETSEFKRIPYELNASNEYRYEKYTNDTVIYNTVLTNKWTLNTDWINDAQSEWLRDLFASPDIKLEILDDPNVAGDQSALISVKCSIKNFETKKQVNDKCFNITIEIENALQDVRQRC